jgi:demethylmenaquinone methyltransferase/2-methoxy-6-polyprenyl-1,4-benzoquinol methylase
VSRYGPGDVRFFDRLAAVYDRLMPPARRGPLRRGLARADGPVEWLLDVGGGPGRAVAGLDVAERTVIDAAAGMCRRARARGLGAVRGDAGRLPVADGAVDAVTVVDALHHLPDPGEAVREAARVLRPGGVLVVREFDPATVRGRALVAAERAVGFDSTFLAPDDLAGLLAEAGLAARVLDRGFSCTVVGKRGSH